DWTHISSPSTFFRFMDLTHAEASLPLVGAILQLGGAALLVGFFALLRRFVFRRPYFSAWVSAWLAITVGIAAVVSRHVFVAGLDPAATDASPLVRALY